MTDTLYIYKYKSYMIKLKYYFKEIDNNYRVYIINLAKDFINKNIDELIEYGDVKKRRHDFYIEDQDYRVWCHEENLLIDASLHGKMETIFHHSEA